MILSIFIFQTKFKKITADEEEVLGGRMWDCEGGAWGRGKVLGEWRTYLGSEGGARGVKEVLGGGARCWGSGGRAGLVKEV